MKNEIEFELSRYNKIEVPHSIQLIVRKFVMELITANLLICSITNFIK
jgi:hypothetical protein